jgi:hypothetical protein
MYAARQIGRTIAEPERSAVLYIEMGDY